ncbi:MAG: EAL domain-containing protein, partial [Lachnospiraceae bacterium]|nr:EAL domain-containing protein [Lachnospiraceae bacterium]
MGQTMALASFGLHDRVEFFGLMTERLGELTEEKYCLIAVDIGHFKVFNKWYGWEAGERFLNRIANELNLFEKRNHAIAGYFGGDNFALFVENDEELLGRMQKNLQDAAFSMGNMVGFLPVYGIYEVVDPSVSVYNMYDCALAALAHVTSKYEVRSCVYVPEMTEQIEAELRMIMEVKDALLAKQFTFYVQPKCCISNGKVVGAEALVRWIHPERGQIPPGEFIPVLEKNGFIGDLDRYVWEEVCSALHEWKKQGISPVPVSINVSRMDILTMDVVGYLKNLVDKYQVD